MASFKVQSQKISSLIRDTEMSVSIYTHARMHACTHTHAHTDRMKMGYIQLDTKKRKRGHSEASILTSLHFKDLSE